MQLDYPIFEVLPAIKEQLTAKNFVILQAPPGAGKSTVLPLELMEETWLEGKKIVMLEPRRLATRSVAMRMAQLRGEEVGKRIGYRVRFENAVSNETQIEVITEGILTRMIQTDNSLEEVGLVIFDEFHERSLQADLALALCYQIQQVLRSDLRILIMSATLEGDRIGTLFDDAPVITSSGRQHPISFKYLANNNDELIVNQIVRIVKKALTELQGDLLVFLPGAGEIKRTAELLENNGINAIIYPLYGDLSFKKQQEAIAPHPTGQRKIVLATSIAETSLTIEGITIVIDSGLSRVPKFDPRSGLTKLETIRVTKDAADQRAGRAGRLGPGTCYRLWTEASNNHLLPSRKPEILEADLASLVLELAEWGEDINSLKWIDVPSSGSVNQARELLHNLGALKDNAITDRGRRMSKLPTHPRIAHMLLEAKNDFQLSLACDLAALLEERDPMPREVGVDVVLRLQALRKWRSGERVSAERQILERIEKLAASWRRILNVKKDNTTTVDEEAGILLLAAYPDRIAKQLEKYNERYKLANGRIILLPKHDDLVREPWIVAAQLDAGQNEGRVYLAAGIHENDLRDHATEQEVVRWDRDREMVIGVVEKRIGNVVLASKSLATINQHTQAQVIINYIRDSGLNCLNWDASEFEFQARIMSLKKWRPDEPWPNLSEEHLIETLEDWLAPFLKDVQTLNQLQRLDWNAILTSLLPWDLANRYNELAPQKLEVPSGSYIKVNYFDDGRPPEMAVRLQEVFGLLETPCVNQRQIKITMHLLSPGYKSVQVTQDLRSFWKNTYHEVRKELRSRYPKHSWPEDPWTAQAVRGVKKK